MNINRHNYEEHFILYWDNELTAAQKQMVEDFVKENADLQNEFKFFGATRFTPDNHVQYEKKELLLSEDGSFINATNYEEQLLCFIDDELTTEQGLKVEKFVSEYPAAQKELALLQKAKLQPEEEIGFPDKSVLYRREEKVFVIKMSWLRVAVAAALVLIAGFATFKLVNNKNGEQTGIAGKGESVKQPINQPVNDQPTDIADAEKKSLPATQTPAKKETQKTLVENPVAANKITVKKSGNKNNLPKPNQNTSDPIIAQVDVPQDAGQESMLKASEEIRSNTVAKTTTDTKNNINDKSIVTEKGTPSYTLYQPEGSSEDTKGNGGLKEFLRKTTRVIERRTRLQTTTDDNKLLVGAFAVSLK